MKPILRNSQGLPWKQLLSWHQYTTIVEYEFLSLAQEKVRALFNIIVMPMLQNILFGAGISGFVPTHNAFFGANDYLSFIAPGIVGLALLWTFSQTIYRLTMDGRYGLQGLKISSGVGGLAYIGGNLTLPVIVALLRTLVMLGGLVLLGTSLPCITNLIVMLGVCMVSTCFWGLVGMLVSFSLKTYAQRDLFLQLAMIPLTLASPVFYPLETAPRYLQLLGFLNPLTYNIIALREAFLYGRISYAWVLVLMATLLLCMASIVVIARKEFTASAT